MFSPAQTPVVPVLTGEARSRASRIALGLLLAASSLSVTATTSVAASATSAARSTSFGQIASSSAQRSASLLDNGSFEAGHKGWRATQTSPARLVVARAGTGSSRAAVLPARRGSVLGDSPNVARGVDSGDRYRLSARVRGSNADVRARLVVRHVVKGRLVRSERARAVVGTRWSTLDVNLKTARPGGVIDVRVAAGGGRGRLAVDDVRLVREPARTAAVVTPQRPSTPPAGSGACGAQGKHAPECGTLWGIYTLQGADPASSVTDLERRVGRQFDLTLRYHDFSDHQHLGQFPDRHQQKLGTTRTLFLSWQARVGSTNKDIRWAAIADGSYDRFITSAAKRLKDWRRPVIVAFDAEFDNLTARKGSVSDYVRAYRRIVTMFRAEGVGNVAWAWVPTGYLGAGNDTRTWNGYPGDDYVDWVGYDPYNFYRCNGTSWKSFEQTISPFYRWAFSKGLGDKPFLLSEYGTQYDAAAPDRSRQWYTDMPSVLPRYPNLKAMIRFDANGVINNGNTCNLWLDNGPGMLDSFAAAGRRLGAALRQ